jgi:hypothetical protein
MALTWYISLITLLIISMCQINLSMALSLPQYRYHVFPDGSLASIDGYSREHYPVMIKIICIVNEILYFSLMKKENYPIVRLMKKRYLV